MSIEDYCRTKAVPPGSVLYYSLLGQPPERRRILLALYALRYEWLEIIQDHHDISVAQAKLAWWRQEIQRLAAGTSRHPICQALGALSPIAPGLQQCLNAVEQELNFSGCADAGQIQALAQLGGSEYVTVMVQATTVSQPAQLAAFARSFGSAWFLFERLLAARKLAWRGRCYIPAEALARFGLEPEDLQRGQTTDAVHNMLTHQALHIREQFQQADQSIPVTLRSEICHLLILQRLLMAQLTEIETDGFRLLEHRVSLTPLRLFWIAFRTLRQERRKP